MRVASNGRLARCGASLSGDSAESRQKPDEADRADHRVEAAGQHAIDGAAADQLQRGADRLPARRARRVHRRRVAVDAVAAREQRQAGRRLAAAEHQRIVRDGRRSGSRSGSSSPSAPQCACSAARSSKSTFIMPAPTAQPQRVASAAVGRMPASRSACSAATSAKRCERFANFRSLRSSISSSSWKSFTSAAMRTGKPLASKTVIGAPPLRPASSAPHVVATSLPTGVTSPMPVIATRAGGHARTRLTVAPRGRSRRGARSRRSLPFARAVRRIVAAFGGRGELRVELEHVARRDERAHLDVRHPRGRGPVPRAASASPRPRAPSRGRSARRAAASPGTPGGAGSGRRRTARFRHVARSRSRSGPRRAMRARRRGATTPWKRPARRARAAQQLEAFRELGRRIELLDRQHRSQAVDELDHGRSADARPAGIGDRLLVAALDLDGERKHVARARRPRGTASRWRAPRPAGRESRRAPSRPTRRAGRPPRRRGTTETRRRRAESHSVPARGAPRRTR